MSFNQKLLFFLGLAVRIGLLFSPGSRYLNEYFIPFLDKAVLSFPSNPWQLSATEAFPYGSFLLSLLLLPRYLAYLCFGSAVLGATAWGIFLVKSVLLFFDLIMYRILSLWAQPGEKRILYLYWLNPVVIFISFIYGQLDVVSMTMAVLSITLLMKGRVRLSAVAFACAILSKFHVALLMPFMCVYLWNRFFARVALLQILQWLCIVGILAAIGFYPLFDAGVFDYVSAGSPEAGRLFAAKISFGHGIDLFLGFLIVFAVLGRLCIATKISEYGLFYGCGVLMGALLLATNPMQGWYLWIVPFLALFYSHYRNVPVALFGLLIASYLGYFVIASHFTDVGILQSMAFTILQGSLVANLIFVFHAALRYQVQIKNRVKPLLLGLGGDSGAGKNHFTSVLYKIFQSRNCVTIEGDDYHKWERGHANWQNITHLHPEANSLLQMRRHAQDIAQGLQITKSHYDHGTGKFTEPKLISPTKTVIVQGLHSFYLKGLRESFDLRIFLAPSMKVRMAWKILRDVHERGHSLEKVLSSLEKRQLDSELHISPQREKSDWILEYQTDANLDPLQITDKNSIPLFLRYYLYNDEPVMDLVEALREIAGCDIAISFPKENIDRMQIDIRGNPTLEQIQKVCLVAIPNLRQITRAWQPPEFLGGLDGINQLFMLSLLSSRV